MNNPRKSPMPPVQPKMSRPEKIKGLAGVAEAIGKEATILGLMFPAYLAEMLKAELLTIEAAEASDPRKVKEHNFN